MNCNEFKELISEYIDDDLDSYNKKMFEEHMKSCKNCMSEYLVFKKIIDGAHELPMEELPKGYCDKLRDNLNRTKKEQKMSMRKRILKYTSIAAVFLLVLSGVYIVSNNYTKNMDFDGIGLSGNNRNDNYAYNESAEQSYDNSEENYDMNKSRSEPEVEGIVEGNNNYSETDNLSVAQNTNVNQKNNRTSKIIKSCIIDTNTVEYDKFVDELTNIIKQSSGYVEYNRTYTVSKSDTMKLKCGDLRVRIPQEKFDFIVKFINNESDVYNQTLNEDDVTKYYYDTENVLTNLKIQEEKLRDLYGKAANLTEILQLESEITRIRTEIDSYSITLSDIDDRVSMSTIQLNITELEGASIVAQPSNNMWKRASEGIIKTINSIIGSVQNFIIWIIINLPYILIVAIILIILLIIIKRKQKKNK